MLTRLFEYFLISKYNRAREQKRKANENPPVVEGETPPEHTVLGHTLPWPDEDKKSETAQLPTARETVTLSPEARRRHVYILGATGTGKTNLLLRLIESDIQNRRAFCVIDLRGDLVDRILPRLAVHAADWQKRLLLIDLRDTSSAVGFNPLAGEGDVYSRAQLLLSVLEHQSGSWGVQLEETLRNCLLALGETGWTLLEVEPLLTNPAFRKEVLQKVTDRQVRGFLQRFDEMSKSGQMSLTTPVLNKITPLLSIPALRNVFGQKDAPVFRRQIDQTPGMVVLVALAADRLHEAAHLAGGLIVSSFQNAIMSRSDQSENKRVPVHLYVDEFESMASERFQAIIAEGRRFGLGLTLSHQNTNQLAVDMRHVLRNNAHTQMYFQTGSQDAAELAKEIASRKDVDAIRVALMAQGMGQAFLVRRGQPSVRMQVLHCPDPVVDRQKVDEVRRASLANYARPRPEIEQELDERHEALAVMLAKWKAAAKGAVITGGGTDESVVYEIRTAKTADMGPKRREKKAKDAGEGKAMETDGHE